MVKRRLSICSVVSLCGANIRIELTPDSEPFSGRGRPDPSSLTSYIRPQRLVVFLQEIVQHDCGVLLMRPRHQHLIDSGVMAVLIVTIIQQITSGEDGQKRH